MKVLLKIPAPTYLATLLCLTISMFGCSKDSNRSSDNEDDIGGIVITPPIGGDNPGGGGNPPAGPPGSQSFRIEGTLQGPTEIENFLMRRGRLDPQGLKRAWNKNVGFGSRRTHLVAVSDMQSENSIQALHQSDTNSKKFGSAGIVIKFHTKDDATQFKVTSDQDLASALSSRVPFNAAERLDLPSGQRNAYFAAATGANDRSGSQVIACGCNGERKANEKPSPYGFYALKLDPLKNEEVDEYQKRLEESKEIIQEFVSNHTDNSDKVEIFDDFKRYRAANRIETRDILYPDQWHYQAIRLEEAWEYMEANGYPIDEVLEEITVAVIDTGLKKEHPDFSLDEQIVKERDFISDTARSRDNDGRDNDADDPGDDPRRPSYHGTHVAGTIGALRNNQFDDPNPIIAEGGVVGVAPGVKIMPLRVLGYDGGVDSDIADAILYAKDNGADIINLSLGGGDRSPLLAAAIETVLNDTDNQRPAVIAAAGNSKTSQPNYPAALPDVIAIGAVSRPWNTTVADPSGMSLAFAYSNFGLNVLLTAPGGNLYNDRRELNEAEGVLSTLWQGSSVHGNPFYVGNEGTSMATPHVAGVSALIKAIFKRANWKDISHFDIRAILTATATQPKEPDRGSPDNGLTWNADAVFWHYGHGILNAYEAVKLAIAIVKYSKSPLLSRIAKVYLYDKDRGELVKEFDLKGDGDGGSIRFIFQELPSGNYELIASTNEDADNTLCEFGDYCARESISLAGSVRSASSTLKLEEMKDDQNRFKI